MSTMRWSDRQNWKRHKYSKKQKKRFKKKDKTFKEKTVERLIKEATKPEKKLKQALEAQNIIFEFQKVINGKNGFIKVFKVTDFYFPRGKMTPLVVEIDGEYHNEIKEQDKKREEFLKENTGCEILRFTNEQVMNNVLTVIETIKQSHILIRTIIQS